MKNENINKEIKFILLMYKETLNTLGGIFSLKDTLFEESIVSPDAIKHIKSNLARIQNQFDALYRLLESNKYSESEVQKNFMISELDDVIHTAESLENTAGSHTSITAVAFALLEKVKNLANNHKKSL